MGPSCRRKTRKSRRSVVKKKVHQSEKVETEAVSPVKSPAKPSGNALKTDGVDFDIPSSNSVCSTPKAKRFRIPEIKTCPPAPKKRRGLSSCSLRRSPIAFFAPPELELFFFCAVCNP